MSAETEIDPIWCRATEFWSEEVRKADGTKKKVMRIGGIATTDDLDQQNERVVQEGLNFQPFLQQGYFNDDHKPGTVLGWPENAKLVAKGERLPSGRPSPANGWWVDGQMIDTPRGREMFEVAKALERQNAPRRLGFSIEGGILRRAGNSITQAIVKEVAITKKPVNAKTNLGVLAKALDGVDKALEAGHGDPTNDPDAGSGAPLRRESLEGAPKQQEETVKGYGAMKTKADWMDGLEQSGMSKSEFEKAIQKAGGGHFDRYQKAMDEDDDMDMDEEAEKAKKSMSVELDDLRKSLASMEERLAKSEMAWDHANDPADAFDDDDINHAASLDVTGLIKSFTDASVTGFRQVGSTQDQLQQLVQLQGTLLKSMAQGQIDQAESFNKLVGEVVEMKKSLTDLGNSPAMRRGATNPREAKVLQRFAKSADGNGGVYGQEHILPIKQAFMKSFQTAHARNDHQAMGNLQAEVTQFERRLARGVVALTPQVAQLIEFNPTAS